MNDRPLVTRRGFVAAGASAVGAAGTVCAARAADVPPASIRSALPLAQEFTVVHRRENPRTYVEGCGLIVLPDGSILAVVSVVPCGGIPKKGPTEITISRTSIYGPDQHDTDHATFHRVRDFRCLARNLFPES